SNAGGVFSEGDVAHVVAAVLDAPMAAYPFVPSFRRDARGGRHPEDNLGGLVAETGLGIALEDGALEAEHGLDQGLPWHCAEPRLGREHLQFPGFPAISAFAPADGRATRLSEGGSLFEAPAQARLVVFHLGEQVVA